MRAFSDVLVCGAGQAGFAVAMELRRRGFRGSVTLLSNEPFQPYERPPLSKAFLKSDFSIDRLVLTSNTALDKNKLSLLYSEAISLDGENRIVTTNVGEIGYGKCVWASGARARLPTWSKDGQVQVLRTFADANFLRRALSNITRPNVVLCGGGFLGLEMAASIADSPHGGKVTVVEASCDIMIGRASQFTIDAVRALHERNGVEILTAASIISVENSSDGRKVVHLANGVALVADVVVAAVGAVPNVEIVAAAGANTRTGVLVDPKCRTSIENVWAIGDVASMLDQDGIEARFESVHNAHFQARLAAADIMNAGEAEVAEVIPTFWSDQWNIRLQTAGRVPIGAITDDLIDEIEGTSIVRRTLGGRLVAIEAINNPSAFRKSLKGVSPFHPL